MSHPLTFTLASQSREVASEAFTVSRARAHLAATLMRSHVENGLSALALALVTEDGTTALVS